MKQTVFLLFIICVSGTLCFALGEAYLRLIGVKPYIRTCPGQYANKPESAWDTDPSLGWIGKRTSPDINPQGFRDTKDFDHIPNTGRRRIMILGDSFMYGTGSPREENVPSLLERKLHGQYDVFNVGVTGWGVDQMYLAYQKYRDSIRPHIVILAFIDDDVVRVLEAYRIYEGVTKPSFDLQHGRLVLRSSCERSWIDVVASRSIFFSLLIREISIARSARSIATHIFNTMLEETKRRRERFIVLRIPQVLSKEKISGPDWLPYAFHIRVGLWSLVSTVRGLHWTFNPSDALYLEPLEDMKLQPGWPDEFYLPDGHLSRRGNSFMADYLAHTITSS